MLNAITVDVEDYFMVSAFKDVVPSKQWGSLEWRVEENTKRILELLDKTGVKATFFFLGCVAGKYPGLVREAARRGHEIGCHSHRHRLIYELTRDAFREDKVRPLPGLPVIRDVVVDMSQFFHHYRAVEPYLITHGPEPEVEFRQSPEQRAKQAATDGDGGRERLARGLGFLALDALAGAIFRCLERGDFRGVFLAQSIHRGVAFLAQRERDVSPEFALRAAGRGIHLERRAGHHVQ